ncbi:hypothetical protein K504DRAFT_449554 [Pleomassaria siparia CBS 279.74]|uniref:Uncharacterized protein n=1 Tax=Pleomassaria siparia CBS 279.74 TaxID=1314801 RepID=A0A6G1JWB3_9PLEO|nr:hypothetical protein K504DRAFT_449554 [Pleomassaria siparia CBS 279.74]
MKKFFRKLRNRRKTDNSRPNAAQKTEPSLIRKENKPLPNPPQANQSPVLNPPRTETKRTEPKPKPMSISLVQNSEPLRLSVEQKREPLSQAFEQYPEPRTQSTPMKRKHAPSSSSVGNDTGGAAPRTTAQFTPTPLSNSTAKPYQRNASRTPEPRGSIDSFPKPIDKRASKQMADAVAHDYAAYEPMLSPASALDNSQNTTLSRDTRSMTDSSKLRHSEDMADRKIMTNSSGHGSSPGSFRDRVEKIGTRKQSVGKRSIGSVGDDSIGGRSLRPVSLPGSKISPSPSTETHSMMPETSNRTNWPMHAARDEPHRSNRKSTGYDNNVSQATDYTSKPRTKYRKPDSERMALRAAIMNGSNDVKGADRPVNEPPDHMQSDLKQRLLKKGVDIEDSVDIDQRTHWAPAVTHEIVKPSVHHIREEEIHREIHNHEVYHRILPVYETEVLPARHFVPHPKGNGLIELSESQIPDCTGANQRWSIGEKEIITNTFRKPVPRITSPQIADETTQMTPEGFPRKETTIIHPPKLEDLSQYEGPIRTIHFPEGSAPEEEGEGQHADHMPNSVPDVSPLSVKRLPQQTKNNPPSPPASPIHMQDGISPQRSILKG